MTAHSLKLVIVGLAMCTMAVSNAQLITPDTSQSISPFNTWVMSPTGHLVCWHPSSLLFLINFMWRLMTWEQISGRLNLSAELNLIRNSLSYGSEQLGYLVATMDQMVTGRNHPGCSQVHLSSLLYPQHHTRIMTLSCSSSSLMMRTFFIFGNSWAWVGYLAVIPKESLILVELSYLIYGKMKTHILWRSASSTPLFSSAFPH